MSVTQRMLDRAVKELNETMGNPTTPYNDDMKPNAGHIFVDHATGGYKLARMSKGGGESSVCGVYERGTKRDVYNQINLMIWAINEKEFMGGH